MNHLKANKPLVIAIVGLLLFLLQLLGWFLGIVVAPEDAQQGQAYRIIYAHVPSAAAALGLCGIALLIFGGAAVLRPRESLVFALRATAEVGLTFTILTLITGSIWGKPTWGTYWEWDPRLTTTLLLAVLLFAYLMVLDALPHGIQRVRIAGALALMIFVDIPIIYKSVTWWRTLHQPASLVASRGQTMAPEMLEILLFNLAATLLLASYFWYLRYAGLSLRAKIEEASLEGAR